MMASLRVADRESAVLLPGPEQLPVRFVEHHLEDLRSDDTQLPPAQDPDPSARASRNRPTCKPTLSTADTPAPGSLPDAHVPVQPAPVEEQTASVQPAAATRPTLHSSGLPAELVELQQAADDASAQLEQLTDHQERDRQRRVWRAAAVAVQAAVTQYARSKGLNRYEVEKQLRQVVRHPRT
jgi:hypothetical protein